MKKCKTCGRTEMNDGYIVCLDCGGDLEQSSEYSSEDADDGIFAECDIPREVLRAYLGIDIGRKGGTSMLIRSKSIEHKMPTLMVTKSKKTKIDIPKIVDRLAHAAEECDRYDIELHYIYERTSSMPHEGVTSAFAFGHSSGGIAYTLELLARMYPETVYIHIVSPASWKKHFELIDSEQTKYQKKLASVRYANKNMNKSFKNTDDGMADALLMAHYARYLVEEQDGNN
jgi:hypothetical protein